VAAQIRDDHPVAVRRQQRRNVDIALNVVGPAVQKNDRRTIDWSSFSVPDTQDAGIDLLQWIEGRVRLRLHHGQICRFCLTGLRLRATGHTELRGDNGQAGLTKKAAAIDTTH